MQTLDRTNTSPSATQTLHESAAPIARGTRLAFIDLLRGWAVFIMIETHTVNALLMQSFRETWWFGYLDFMNGLVAPTFLFCAGCGLWIAINRKWDDYIHLRKPLRKYTGRMLWILAVAYALHLPAFSFRHLYSAFSPADAETLFQVDILHTIVVTSLFAVFIIVVTRSKRLLLWTAGALSAALIIAAPFVWSGARESGYNVVVRNMLTETPRSYFPFIPWSAFVFLGIIATKLYMDTAVKAAFFRRFLITGFIIAAAGLIFRLYYNPYPAELWRSTPIFFAMRLGLVMMAFAGFWMFEERKTHNNVPTKSNLILLFGRESLLVYVAHLVIVYGSVANNGIASRAAMAFNPLQCAGITAILIAAMWLLAAVWNYLKQRHHLASRIVQYSGAAVFLLFLIIND